jgi:hypothetical protein
MEVLDARQRFPAFYFGRECRTLRSSLERFCGQQSRKNLYNGRKNSFGEEQEDNRHYTFGGSPQVVSAGA